MKERIEPLNDMSSSVFMMDVLTKAPTQLLIPELLQQTSKLRALLRVTRSGTVNEMYQLIILGKPSRELQEIFKRRELSRA